MNYSYPHRRWNPLRQSWVLVSPQRATRPWQGQIEATEPENWPNYDPNCALCPGNKRASSEINPAYDSVFIFNNDFPAIFPGDQPQVSDTPSEIIQARTESGVCRVLCFSPSHNRTLPELSLKQILTIINTWQEQYEELGAMPEISHVMTFENKGIMMGCSNPHPHCQIWATQSVPTLALTQCQSQAAYARSHNSALLTDYLAWELARPERIICSNEDWICLVPFWAVWPFETLILPKRIARSISELGTDQREAWAEIIKRLTTRYDNLFQTSFPYSMGIYQLPTDNGDWPGFCLHQIFLPPLLRSATIRKFMVGYEMCAEPQRDLTPEQAAAKLREASEIHYRAA